MADAYEHGEDAFHHDGTSFAANNDYIVIGDSHGIGISARGLEHDGPPFRLVAGPYVFPRNPVLSFSNVNPRHLAVSYRERVVVYDVHLRNPTTTLRGHGRAVSSIAWSEHDGDTIAIGHVDGRIAIFDLRSPLRAKQVILGTIGACRQLSWSPTTPNILAACSDEDCALWTVEPRSSAPLCRWRLARRVQQLLWHPTDIGQLLMLEDCGVVIFQDLQHLLEPLHHRHPDDGEMDMFGGMDDLVDCPPPRTSFSISARARYIGWIGENGLLVLCAGELHLYDIRQNAPASSVPCWRTPVAPSAQQFAVTITTSVARVGLYPGTRTSLVVPPSATEAISTFATSKAPQILQSSSVADDANAVVRRAAALGADSMQPLSIANLRAQRRLEIQRNVGSNSPHRSKTSSTSESRPVSAKSDSTALTALQITPAKSRNLRSSMGSASVTSSVTRPQYSPDSQAMTSSLELPIASEDESLMPFLSPTIPARRSSPLLLLNNDPHIPTVPKAWNTTTLSANDSDSDEETLDSRIDLLKSGGANVPSPRTCGASFAMDGNLLCYFPGSLSSARLQHPSNDMQDTHSPPQRQRRLFPSFGNFARSVGNSDTDTDSEDCVRFSEVASVDIPEIELQPPSFPKLGLAKGRWTAESAKANLTDSLQRSRISRRQLEGAGDLGLLDTGYRLTCRKEETLAHLCVANADTALSENLNDSAIVWRVLSKLVISPVHSVSTGTDRTPIVEQSARRLVRTDSGIQLTRSSTEDPVPEALHWTDASSTSAWLLQDMLEWAERRADVSLLAHVSAVLVTAQMRTAKAERAERLLATQPVSTSLLASAPAGSSNLDKTGTPNLAIPTLRSSTADPARLRPSPKKRLSSSQNSSRATSGPTTPIPEAGSISPSSSFPTIGRSSARLSASGSASPEHHRSSFSATAKAYAQSISEKFSSYGTSPPIKKGSGSPGNELASAMTPGGGSWSKSVSFASTTSTARGSVSGPEVAADDVEDDYDSDRTIDESSYPPTPRITSGPIVLKAKNLGAFADHVSGAAAGFLLSPLISVKATIWMRHYAEYLRRCERFIEATALDNIATGDHPPAAHDGVAVLPATTVKRPTCSICTCKIDGLQHVCSKCLHVAHLQCLQRYIQGLGDEAFECPSGCGCACQSVAFEEAVWEQMEPAVEAATVKRRWSMTDPRIWRARMEGESW